VTLKTLLIAISLWESRHNPEAIGDGGRAVGTLQIHNCVIVDANRIAGTDFKTRDRFNPQKSERIAEIYLIYYGTRAGVRFDDGLSYEEAHTLARIWNGGTQGHKKRATVGYANNIVKQLKEVRK